MTGGKGALIAAVFSAALLAPFVGEAWHVDEPFFLDVAAGKPAPANPAWPELNNNPPLLLPLLSAARRATGGGEAPMRLFFLPFDLLAAASLYLLAARFLKRPLVPALVAIASPAYLINLGHLMAEKPAAALAFFGLWLYVKGLDDDEPLAFWAAAAAFAAASLSKYLVVFAPAAAFCYGWSRGKPRGRLAAHAALSLVPLAVFFLVEPAALSAVRTVSSGAAGGLWSAPSHRLRAFLAFTGGCAAGASLWCGAAPRRVWAASAACAAALFLPWFDLAPVRGLDRALGAAFSAAGLVGLARAARLWGPRSKGGALWAAWAGFAGVLCLAYWCVMARTVLFVLPPVIFALAEALEARARAPRRELAALAVSVPLSLALAAVDARYAGAQREMAERAAGFAQGGRVWSAGHLGLRYYLERAGAEPVDWALVRPGDAVVSSATNSALGRPPRPIPARVDTVDVDEPIPLRLISLGRDEAGFYSSIGGFLPFTVSREPVERFIVVRPR